LISGGKGLFQQHRPRADPVGKGGYEIVHDEVKDMFGLAHGGTFIAYYGNFIETFIGM
jgi:hypothetical protein